MKDVVAQVKQLWWLAPFLVIVSLFALFFSELVPGLPAELGARGQYGDSFGVLNSLFTGLGFAGLLVTIGLQQRQIKKQAQDFQAQLQDAASRRYEDNLYRLLENYRQALDAVLGTKHGQSARSRDALRIAVDTVLEKIRAEKLNSIPHEIQARYHSKTLTLEDEDVLEYLYYQNFLVLNYGLNRQWRLIESMKALLNHMEAEAPLHLDVAPYRRIVLSQITHIEVSYFFLVALAFHDEEELRQLFVKSGLIRRASTIYKMQIHRFMYLKYWNYDLRRDKIERPLPIPKARVKALERKKQDLRRFLDEASKPSNTQTLEASDRQEGGGDA